MTEIYQNIKHFDNFDEVSDPRHYVALPSDWAIFVAHVPQAAQAIEAGRYRDVNTIGVACITAVRNALNGVDFPFVFAGDTASILLPKVHHLDAVDALLALSRIVEKNFQLKLSIGSMFVYEIESERAAVQVARYEIDSGMCIALFRGGGVALANNKIKTGECLLHEEDANDYNSLTSVNLQGLSCRWDKIPNKHGCIMTLLVRENEVDPEAPPGAPNIYEYVTGEIDNILSGSIHHANPVHMDLAAYKPIRQIIKEERRLHASACSPAFMYRVIEICLCVLIFTLGLLKQLLFDSTSYKEALRTHADYRKFDDMLRLVIDCTPDQAHAIECMLQDQFRHGRRLYFGVHCSTYAVITCMVDDPSAGRHIHFVDGDNGGYCQAAMALRKQMGSFGEAGRVSKPFTVNNSAMTTPLTTSLTTPPTTPPTTPLTTPRTTPLTTPLTTTLNDEDKEQFKEVDLEMQSNVQEPDGESFNVLGINKVVHFENVDSEFLQECSDDEEECTDSILLARTLEDTEIFEQEESKRSRSKTMKKKSKKKKKKRSAEKKKLKEEQLACISCTETEPAESTRWEGSDPEVGTQLLLSH